MSDRVRERKLEDLRGIKDDSKWPLWPLLPLRRSVKGKEPDIGFLVSGYGPVVVIGNVFAVMDGEVAIKDLDRKEYGSYEEMLDDEWYVD